MLFDERELYFAQNQRGPYQQGDILLAPTGCFETHEPPSDEVEPARVGAALRRQMWSDGRVDIQGGSPVPIPAADVMAQFRPAMIVSHDCTLQKDFNREVHRLRERGKTKKEASAIADADPALDRYMTVAPLIPFTAAGADRARLKQNDVLGFFPVCAWEDRAVDEGVIDLGKVATVDRQTVVGRLATISTDARRALMFALARFWVFRVPQVAYELEDAVNLKIRDVRVSEKDPLVIDLQLSDGTVLELIQTPEPSTPAGTERSNVP